MMGIPFLILKIIIIPQSKIISLNKSNRRYLSIYYLTHSLTNFFLLHGFRINV
jgi:hypothetical protein